MPRIIKTDRFHVKTPTKWASSVRTLLKKLLPKEFETKLNQEKQIKQEILWPSDARVTSTRKAKLQWRTRQSRGPGPRSTNQRLPTSRCGRQKATRETPRKRNGRTTHRGCENRQVGHNVPMAEWSVAAKSENCTVKFNVRFLKKLTPDKRTNCYFCSKRKQKLPFPHYVSFYLRSGISIFCSADSLGTPATDSKS